MWILDVVVGDGGSDTTFYLVAGEWSVGRKRCHLNFHADSSISRTHALIRVGALKPEQLGDPCTRPMLELVDMDSRFGTFVNQEQIFGTRDLQHGDHISFGAKKSVLRVRYQAYVLVASRIQRANREYFNDTCQRIGMHLVATERKDATHCVMDPGLVVATVKVLWALVFNQPVVCTPWIYAILNRSNLSDPLPRCEDFLPSDPSVPMVESNYLPSPLRKTLFQGYAVVFLAPQSIEELIAAMGGIVIAAYTKNEEDDCLVRELDVLALRKRLLLVEPSNGTGSFGTAGKSDQWAAGALDPSYRVEIVNRRVALFKSMGAVFTSVSELAASVIYVRPPTVPNVSPFSSSHAAYADSSVQIMSSSVHLNLLSTTSTEDKNLMQVNKEDQEKDDDIASVTVKKSFEQQSNPNYEFVEGITSEVSNAHIVQNPTMREREEPLSTNMTKREMPLYISNDKNATIWKSSRVLQARDVKFEEKDIGKPIVVSCSLITKRRRPSGHTKTEGNGLVNYKPFTKGNGCSLRSSTTSLFPQRTVVSVVDNAERRALRENLKAMDAQERIAEELFAMAEGRTATKLF